MKAIKTYAPIVMGIILITGLLLSACQTINPPKTYIVGVVNPAEILNPVLDGFKAGMADLGYAEGERITYIYAGAVSKDDLERTIQALLDKKVDLILALSTPGAQAVQKATSTVPVIFVPVTDPLSAGLVTSVQQPGGNMTGIMTGAAEARRFEWLVKVTPNAKRIYMPYNPNDKSPVGALPSIRDAASKLGVELVTQETGSAEEIKAAIQAIPGDVDALFIGPDSLVGSFYADWIAAAIEHKLPLSGSSRSHVEAGMLLSYSYDTFEVGKQSAHLADQIFKGVKPGELPVENSEFLLSLNLKTAGAIGLNISDEVLRQAKTIIR